MAYDNNVPQATQTIAQTQPIINENFAFLDSAIDQEHNFDVTDATKTYHKQASMPNQADPVALPAGTDGIYYVNGGLPKFYNGTAFSLIGNVQIASGVNNIAGGGAFTILASGNYMGIVSIFRGPIPTVFEVFQFNMDGTNLVANNRVAVGGSSQIILQVNGSGDLQIKNGDSVNRSFRWQVFYAPAP